MPDGIIDKAKEKAKRAWDKVKTYAVAAAVAVGFSADSSQTPAPKPANNNTIDVITAQATAPSKEDLAEKLATADAKRFTELQGKYADNLIKQIQSYTTQYEKKEEANSGQINAAIKNFQQQSGYADALAALNKKKETENMSSSQYIDEIKKLKQEYHYAENESKIKEQFLGPSPTKYANKICGLGNKEENYCIALQTTAMNKAVKELGQDTLKQVREAMGWTVNYANNSFKQNGFSSSVTMENLFTTDANGNNIVNKGPDGKPLINDGDICLVALHGNTPCHCIRLNVDEKGVLTYSAGNEERDHARITSLKDKKATIISTENYAKNLAKANYMSQNANELLALAETRNVNTAANTVLYASARDRLKEELKAQTGEELKNPAARAANLRIDMVLQNHRQPDEVRGIRHTTAQRNADSQEKLPNPPTYQTWLQSQGR